MSQYRSMLAKWERYRTPERGERSIDDALADLELESVASVKAAALAVLGQVKRGYCDCAECHINGKQFALHQRADCLYAQARAALVPEAERLANKRVRIQSVDEDQGKSKVAWLKIFCAEMERLAAPLLRSSNGATPLAGEEKPVIECWSMRPPEVPCVAAE